MKKFIYCPYCSTKLHDKHSNPSCPSCNRSFYKNSKPCVGVILINNDQMLLSKRGKDPHKDTYDIPGGFLEYGEQPEDGAHREILEETGTQIEIIGLLGMYTNDYGIDEIKTLDIIYLGKIISGEPKANDDVAELTWFPISSPPKNFAFPNLPIIFADLQKFKF